MDLICFPPNFRVEIENLANATDFSPYLKLLKMCNRLSGHLYVHYYPNIHDVVYKAFDKLYAAYFTFANRPKAFDNAEQLNEVDRLHIELWERNLLSKKLTKQRNRWWLQQSNQQHID